MNYTATQESQQGFLCPYPMEKNKAQAGEIIESIKMTDVRSIELSLLTNSFPTESVRMFWVASSKMT